MAVAEAVAAIRRGEPVVLPTDTVYGLCASPAAEEPVRLLRRLKGRAASQPIALLAADVDSLLAAIPELSAGARAAAGVLLPGPYTLVIPNPARRYPWLAGSNPDAIGVRVPELVGDAREVVVRAGPVAATSANRHGEPDPRRLLDVPAEIRAACGTVIDGGQLPGTPSTVLDLTGAKPSVVREGVVPADDALKRARAALS